MHRMSASANWATIKLEEGAGESAMGSRRWRGTMSKGATLILVLGLEPPPSVSSVASEPTLTRAEREVLSLSGQGFDDVDEPDLGSIEPVSTPVPPRCADASLELVDEPDFTEARDHVRALLDRGAAPAIAVGVSVRGRVIWSEGFGWADVERQIPATADTAFSLASVSKPFTATAIMVLAEQGRLQLDRPINDYLPPPAIREGRGDPRLATVRRVAGHSAGLPQHFAFYYADGPVRPPRPEETRQRYAVTIRPPGTAYRYSNLGYGLLEHVIAARSGASYPEFLRREVFDPLGLSHSSVGPATDPRVEIAVRYGHGMRPLPDYGFDHDGASAIYASVHDLLAFGNAHLGLLPAGTRPILSEASRKGMLEPIPPAKGYAMGWGVGRVDGMRVFGHTGGMPGVSTVLRVYPEAEVVVAVLANTSGAGGAVGRAVALSIDALGFPARSSDLCRLPVEHPMFGRFRGRIDDGRHGIELELHVRRDGAVTVMRPGRSPAVLRGVTFDGTLRGWFFADVGAELGGGRPTVNRLAVRAQEDRVDGEVAMTVVGTASTSHRFTAAPVQR